MPKTAEKYLCIHSVNIPTGVGSFKSFVAGKKYDLKEIPEGGCEKREKKDKEGTVVGHEKPVPSPVYFIPAPAAAEPAPATEGPAKASAKKPEEVKPDAD